MGHIARHENDSPLHVKSRIFVIAIVKMVKQNNDWRVNSLFQQIRRSGTSIHANVRESEFVQSSSDFISNSRFHSKRPFLSLPSRQPR